jgi:thiopeptide-type bacteriocin biosynthesis protein
VVDGVLAVLAGTPVTEVACSLHIRSDELAAAVELYKSAGLAALEDQAPGDWYQVRVQWRDWESAERVAAMVLAPQLDRLRGSGVLGSWWFVRKAPCWRLRLRPGSTSLRSDLAASVSAVLDDLTVVGHAERWSESIYDPEQAVFGGRLGISVAHDLFSADGCAIMDYLRRAAADSGAQLLIGRRELSVLLCSTLMRAAGQEWHEQGDVWLRVARMRPTASTISGGSQRTIARLTQLITASTEPSGEPFGERGRLSFIAPWFAAFADAGRALGTAANDGSLRRGIRDILAHHVIFHWNRLGLGIKDQSILAAVASTAILSPFSDTPTAECRLDELAGTR